MPSPNIPLDRLKAVSETMAELIEEAMTVELHFKKKETLRNWPRILKLINKTELRLTFREANTIAADILRLAEENERLQGVFRGMYMCGAPTPCHFCPAHGAIISNMNRETPASAGGGNTMKKYRKKPVVVEAMRLQWNTWSEMCDFVGVGKLSDGKPEGKMGENNAIGLAIPTLEGLMMAEENDWVIKGVKGEFYPCKPDIFEATYEEVSP